MERVFFYSDESKDSARFAVAGVAIAAHANIIKRKLLRAERESGKGARDWHDTKDSKVRRRYIEEVLRIPQLDGCAFSYVYEAEVNPFEATVVVLQKAIARFAAGRRCVIVHEGFMRTTREKTKRRLRELGLDNVTVEAGRIKNEPRIRLADALAGFSRIIRSDSKHKDAFAGLEYEGWFLSLE